MAKKKSKLKPRYAFMSKEGNCCFYDGRDNVVFYKSVEDAEADSKNVSGELGLSEGDRLVLVSVEIVRQYEVQHVVEVVRLSN